MAIRDLGFPHDPDQRHPVPPRKHGRWKRVVAWIASVIAALIVVAAAGIYVLLHSGRFHNYVLGVAEGKASAALNTRVAAQNFALHLSPLSLDLYGITVYGVGPGAGRPLLAVDHIGLGVRILSLLHREWNLESVTVDHPVADLIVAANGQNNTPSLQSSSSSSNTNVFQLAIGHILLDGGVIYYNNHATPLYADLHNLQFHSSYTAANGGRYYGTLSYSDGHLQYGSYAPMPHDLQAQFDATPAAMTLSNVKLTSGQSQVLLNATLDDYSNPKVQARYVVILALGELRNALRQPSLPAGVVLVNGTADYTSVPNRPALDTTTLTGNIHSRLLQLRTATLRTAIRELNADYSFAGGNAELRNLTAQLLGGMVRANATVRDVTGNQQGRVIAEIRGISLADLKTIANSGSLKPVAITGQVNANSEATWSGSFKNALVRADAVANANVAPAQKNAAGGAVPLNAEIHARYNGRTQEVAFNRSYVRLPQTALTLNGTVSQRSALQVQLQANDLHELETIADLFSPPAQPLDLYGSATFDGTVRGSTAAPRIAGQLNAANVSVRGSKFRVLRTGVEASPSQISLQNGDLELERQQGRVTFNLQSGLHDWSHLPASPFAANVSATQVSIAKLARAANLTTSLSGTLNANIVAHGTELNPVGQGEVTLHNANISGEPVQLADVRFQGTGDVVHSNLLVRIGAGTAQGQLTYYPRQQGYDAVLQATNIHLQQIQILRQRNLQVSGTMNLTASGHGTLKNPEATASLTIPQLEIQKQQIRDVNFHGSLANREATFTLGSQIANTPLKAQGKVALTGDYYADLTLDTPVIPLEPILAMYAPSQAGVVSGRTEIHATVRGPLKVKALLEANLNVPTLAVNYRATTTAGAPPVNVQIAAVEPIRASFANGVVTLQPGEIKGTDTDVRFQGQMPLAAKGPSTLSVHGAINLALAEVFDPTLSSGGQMQFDINAAGHNPSENVEGEIRIVNASFSTPDAPLGLSNGNGVLTLRRDRLDITQFAGNVGGGTITASGGMAYRPAMSYDIALKGSNLRLLYPQTVRTDFGLNLAMVGNTTSGLVSGQVNINRISFTPDFDLSSFMTQFNGVATPPPAESFEDNLKLNLVVRSTSELNVVSPTVSVQGDANLRVVGTASDPVIVGRANLTDGDVIFLGNRYLIQGGTIAFLNTIETEPVLNLQVNTTIQQYRIAMHFRGPLDRLRTDYTSDPALAQADIIHLIAFGNTEEAANAAPAQSTTLGAESLIASQVTSQVTSRLQKTLGVSQISVDPQLGSTVGTQQQGARLTVRQRVTSKLFVTFSTDVTTTQYSAVQLQYQLNRKWSLSGVRDQNGGFSVDGRYHKDF